MATRRVRYCFVSFPWGEAGAQRIFRTVIRPALAAGGWQLLDPREVEPGRNIFEWAVESLRRADLVIVDLTRSNSTVLYELGMAHAWGKRTVVLLQSLEGVPQDVATRYPVLVYSRDEEGRKAVLGRLTTLLRELATEPPLLQDPVVERLVDPTETVAIELLNCPASAVELIAYFATIVSALNDLEPLKGADLREVRTGSLGGWIRAECTSIASLAEKILFFVPEWRLKNAERVRVEAEAELLRAQAERTRAEADSTSRDSDRKDAELVLRVLDSPPSSVGRSRITIGELLRLERDESGVTTVGVPGRRRGPKQG